MQHKVPSFISPLPQEEKAEAMKEYIIFKKSGIAKMMVKHYEGKLDLLIRDDEDDSPLSWFQSKWSRAKRLGERLAYRKLIKDLKD